MDGTSGHASVQFVFRLHSLVPKMSYFGMKIRHFSVLICNSVTYLHRRNHVFNSLIIHMGNQVVPAVLEGWLKSCISDRRSPVILKSNPLHK